MANQYRDPNTGKFISKPGRKAPKTTPILRDVSEGFAAIVRTAKDVLINPDLAYRTDRTLQEQMLRDPMVMGPLQKRMLATAQLDWEIVPEDDNDETQQAAAAEVQKVVDRIPRLIDLFRDCLWGIWKGTGATEINWAWDDMLRMYVIDSHRPHNGDKFTYDIHGQPRILTDKDHTRGRDLSAAELERLIIHVFDPEDGAFFDGAEAAYLFKGRGLRDLAWQYWWLKHNALFFWMNFMERYGGGMIFGRYPMQNAEAKAAIESVLQNLVTDSKVSVPVPAGAENAAEYGVEVQTLGGEGKSAADLFQAFVEDWAGKHLRFLILGQEFGYEQTGDGLGSDRATRLQDTFRSYRDYDATTLAQTLTDQLVERIIRFNWGKLPFRLKFQFILEEDDYEQAERQVKMAKEINLPIGKEWAYKTLGIPQPKEDDEILEFVTDPNTGMGAGMTGGLPTAGRLAGLFSDVRPGVRKYQDPERTAIVPKTDNLPAQPEPNGPKATIPEITIHPNINVHVPEQKPPDVHVDVAAPHVDVHVPQQAPPEVKVDVAAPNVEVAAPNVTLEPNIELNPQFNIPTPDVKVENTIEDKAKNKRINIRRDKNTGQITGADVEETD